MVKNSPANEGDAGDTGLIPARRRSPGEGHGNPLQYSCLENPMDRGAWWATVHAVAKSQTHWSDLLHNKKHVYFIIKSKQDLGHEFCSSPFLVEDFSLGSALTLNTFGRTLFWHPYLDREQGQAIKHFPVTCTEPVPDKVQQLQQLGLPQVKCCLLAPRIDIKLF